MSLADLARQATGKAKPKAPAPVKKTPLKRLLRVHKDFVTAYLAQRFADPGGAWMRVSTELSHQVATEHALWLIDQPIIQTEIEHQLVPLLMDESFDRRWVAQQLYHLAEANIFDYIRVERTKEVQPSPEGLMTLDDTGEPVYKETARVMLLEDFDTLPVWKQRNLKKLKIRRGKDGDVIELEIFDRHKAINDIARYAGMDREDNREQTGKVFAEEMRKAALRQERMAQDHRRRMLEDQNV